MSNEPAKPALPPMPTKQTFDDAMAKRRAAEAAHVGAQTRKPFGALSQRLYIPKEYITPGHRAYVFNDAPGRIARALEGGYKHIVDKKDGSHLRFIVGTAPGGGALYGYAMEIPQEWHDEDMAAQQREIDEREKGIKQGDSNVDNKYVPTTGIKIEQGRRR